MVARCVPARHRLGYCTLGDSSTVGCGLSTVNSREHFKVRREVPDRGWWRRPAPRAPTPLTGDQTAADSPVRRTSDCRHFEITTDSRGRRRPIPSRTGSPEAAAGCRPRGPHRHRSKAVSERLPLCRHARPSVRLQQSGNLLPQRTRFIAGRSEILPSWQSRRCPER